MVDLLKAATNDEYLLTKPVAKKAPWYQLLTGTGAWCTSLMRFSLRHNGGSGYSRSLFSTSLTIAVQILSFWQRVWQYWLPRMFGNFFYSSRVDNTMLELAQNNIKCALSQLTTFRPHSQYWSHFQETCAMCWNEWKNNLPNFISWIIVKINRKLTIFRTKMTIARKIKIGKIWYLLFLLMFEKKIVCMQKPLILTCSD